MFVLGTAGHVDHGKSALVHALTGIDPDRLDEEKERGMTIDLGFAWIKLPSGREVSLVDVPGHERFIKNMLAGVGGIDLALLVVAADEGVMPQTREHLAILDLLRIERGIIVITKKDLVDDELLDLVTMEVRETVEATLLAEAPIVATSAISREGLVELAGLIDSMLEVAVPRRDIGRPRLPIDRVFTIAGFGTIVTGTLIDGRLTLGQELEIVPQRTKARLRGLQTHKMRVESVGPGRRVAVNLAGITTSDLHRGDVLTTPGWLVPSTAADVRIRLISSLGHTVRHNTMVTFHSHAAEVESRIRLLDKEEIKPGESGWAQLALEHPVALVKGDFFIVRSSKETLGGGEVVDAYPRRHRRFHAGTLNNLASREKGSPDEVLVAILETKGPLSMDELLRRSSLSSAEAETLLNTLTSEGRVVVVGDKGPKALVFSAGGWNRLVEQVQQAVGEHHRRFPLRPGLPKEEIKSRLKISAQLVPAVLRHMVLTGALAEDARVVRLPSFNMELRGEQQAKVDSYIRMLSRDPYSPSSEISLEPELLDYLVAQRKVVKLADNVIFAAQAYDTMVQKIVDHIKAKGKITVAEVRDLFQTSRKYALAVMEHLDEIRVTRRVGDERILR